MILRANTDVYLPKEYMREGDQRVILSSNFLRDFGIDKPKDGYVHYHIVERTKSEDAWRCAFVV